MPGTSLVASPLLAFLTGEGTDAAGRSFAQILAMTDAALEHQHDFIQWLFPLDEPSRAVPGSPVLDPATVQALRASAVAQARLDEAAARMLRFYRETSAWRRSFDHNHLRITRIIRSLRLLRGDHAADGFRHAIVALAEGAPIDAQARGFWNDA